MKKIRGPSKIARTDSKTLTIEVFNLTFFERIYHAWLVLTGKARAYEIVGLKLRNSTDINKEIDKMIKEAGLR